MIDGEARALKALPQFVDSDIYRNYSNRLTIVCQRIDNKGEPPALKPFYKFFDMGARSRMPNSFGDLLMDVHDVRGFVYDCYTLKQSHSLRLVELGICVVRFFICLIAGRVADLEKDRVGGTLIALSLH